MGFSRQEYWSGLPFPFPGDLPDPGIEPRSPALQVDALTSEPPGKPNYTSIKKREILDVFKLSLPSLHFTLLKHLLCNIGIIRHEFNWSVAFYVSHEISYVIYISFPFVLKYFPVSIMISSLTCCLFKRMLCNFHIFVDFPVFLLLLIFIFILLCISKIWFQIF